MRKASAINQDVLDTEVHVEHSSGKRMAMLGSAVSLRDSQGNVRGSIGAFMDITDRKIAEQKLEALNDSLEHLVLLRTEKIRQQAVRLRHLAVQLGQIEQAESKRLAKIVHDQIQQLIVAARMQVEWLMKKADRPQEEIRSVLERIHGVLREALQESRSLTVQISPPILQKAGLSGCLAWLAAQMWEQHQFRVNFHAGIETDLTDETIVILLFESVRELLLNAIKHSSEKEADVDLLPSGPTAIKIAVRDKGHGFHPVVSNSQQAGASFGLFSVEERLNHFGGYMAIECSLGQGSTITLTIPLDDKQLLTDQQGPITEQQK
ncbi:PAS domain-containing sensor histidine kinase [Desulfofustis glycolicus]|uniref:Oxygen sensor histidine kinase NreB n=1 Tax=Desulfofustis glycolicus DSM 9705 TaxID=1121409 RepID=A0A1M5YEP5_9BACT|nr:ATP-binding protein [Desulfofustis glycolicus]MCB2215221.1 hypothetical protein [Desulfobulbaceae bacterium]SHI10505.1 PAS domain S-box-containing protein [Desulfofustis glycolicus DSM 9705]